jgi:hypothetical protein
MGKHEDTNHGSEPPPKNKNKIEKNEVGNNYNFLYGKLNKV